MTEDNIKEFAYQVGHFFLVEFGTASASMDWLRKFADLVAAKERKECAKVCEDQDTGKDLPYDLAVIECAKAIRARKKK